MPDLQVRARQRTSDHSLLVSLGVCLVLVLGYALALKLYGLVSMADGVIEHGTRVTVSQLHTDGDTVSVVLPDGGVDELNYVSDPGDYRTPLEVAVWDQRDKRPGVNDQLVFAVQDLDHLAGERTRRLVAMGFGGLALAFVVAAVYLNRPRRRAQG